jgi:hypothetical protein
MFPIRDPNPTAPNKRGSSTMERNAKVIIFTAKDATKASIFGTAITISSCNVDQVETLSAEKSIPRSHMLDGEATGIAQTPGPTGLIGQTVSFGVPTKDMDLTISSVI